MCEEKETAVSVIANTAVERNQVNLFRRFTIRGK